MAFAIEDTRESDPEEQPARRLSEFMQDTGKPARLLASSLGRHLLSGAAVSFGLKLGATGLAFVLQLVLARALGKAYFGTYALALTWTGVLVLVGKLGMDSAALRFLPEYRSQGRPAARLGFLAHSQRWVLRASTLAGLAGCVAVLALSSLMNASTRAALYVAFGIVPLLSLLHLFAGYLQAEKRILASQGPLLCLLPGFAILGVLFAFRVLDVPATPATALALYGASAALALAVSRGSFRGHERRNAAFAAPPTEADRAWFSVGTALLLTSGFGLLLAHADILMLGFLAGSEATAEYAVANRLARFLSFPLLAANAIVAPVISELYYAQRKEELQKLLEHATQGILLVCSPILLLLAFQAEPILRLYGPGFVEGKPAFLILLMGHAVHVLMGSAGFLLALTGGHRSAARILGVTAVLNVVLNAVLIPPFGPLGAALATAGTTMLWSVSMYVVVRKRTGIRASFF